MKKLRLILVAALAAAMCLGAAAVLTGCGPEETPSNVLTQPTDFEFNPETGEYSFTGVENAGYYFVRVYGYNEVLDADESVYCATSERISGGTGEKSGTVDTSGFICGPYRAKLTIGAASGTDYVSPDPVCHTFYMQEGTKLITPQFKVTTDGNAVKLSADGYVLATYIRYQCFPVWTYTIKDSSGNTVQTIELKLSDLGYDLNLVSMQNNYAFGDSLEKNLTLTPGTYTVQAAAEKPTTGNQIVSADASETVTFTVSADGSDEQMTTYWDEPTNPGFGFGFVVGDGKYQFDNPEILEYTGEYVEQSGGGFGPR